MGGIKQRNVQSGSSTSALTYHLGVDRAGALSDGEQANAVSGLRGLRRPEATADHSEITAPIGFPRLRDSARAACRTSSSRSRVVVRLMQTSRITHLASSGVRRGQGQVFAFRLKRFDDAIPAEYASDN